MPKFALVTTRDTVTNELAVARIPISALAKVPYAYRDGHLVIDTPDPDHNPKRFLASEIVDVDVVTYRNSPVRDAMAMKAEVLRLQAELAWQDFVRVIPEAAGMTGYVLTATLEAIKPASLLPVAKEVIKWANAQALLEKRKAPRAPRATAAKSEPKPAAKKATPKKKG